MKSLQFYNLVKNSSAHRAIRDEIAAIVLDKRIYFDDLLLIALDINDENHHKACWILEIVLEYKINWLEKHLNQFCATLLLWKHDGAIRSVSKIGLFLIKNHIGKLNENKVFLTENQIDQIITVSFFWLTGEDKVASKAYAMRALYEAGKLQPWIYPELTEILNLGYSSHSPAYTSAAKDVLRNIKKFNI